MTVSISNSEPLSFVAGDTVRWQRADIASDYSGYTLTYTFTGSATPVVAVASVNGTVTLTAGQTTSMVSGRWQFAASVSFGGERTTVAAGYVNVTADPSLAVAGTVTLSHARRTLAAIEATIEGRATSADHEIALSDGRKLVNVPIADLIRARGQYRAEVNREDISERLARGDKPRNRILVRM